MKVLTLRGNNQLKKWKEKIRYCCSRFACWWWGDTLFFLIVFPLGNNDPLASSLAMVKVRLFPFKKFASEWSVTWLEGHVLCLLLLFFVCDHDFQACQIIRVSRLKLSFRTSNSLFYKKVIIHLTDIVSALGYRPDISLDCLQLCHLQSLDQYLE